MNRIASTLLLLLSLGLAGCSTGPTKFAGPPAYQTLDNGQKVAAVQTEPTSILDRSTTMVLVQNQPGGVYEARAATNSVAPAEVVVGLANAGASVGGAALIARAASGAGGNGGGAGVVYLNNDVNVKGGDTTVKVGGKKK